MMTTSTSSPILGDLQCLLYGVLVKLRQQSVARSPVDSSVGGKGSLSRRIWNMLDQHNNLHFGSVLRYTRCAKLLMSNIRLLQVSPYEAGEVASEKAANRSILMISR